MSVLWGGVCSLHITQSATRLPEICRVEVHWNGLRRASAVFNRRGYPSQAAEPGGWDNPVTWQLEYPIYFPRTIGA